MDVFSLSLSLLPGSSICILTDVIFYALLLMIASTSNKGKGGTARASERERVFSLPRKKHGENDRQGERENNINQ